MLTTVFRRFFLGYSAITIGTLGVTAESFAQSPPTATSVTIQSNSNNTPAGKLEKGVLTLHLELRQGDWYPEAETGPSMKVYAGSGGIESTTKHRPDDLFAIAITCFANLLRYKHELNAEQLHPHVLIRV